MPRRPDNIHPVRYRQLAQRGERYRPQALANLKNPAERNALLLAFLHEQHLQLIDQLVDMFDRWLTDLMRRGRNKQKVGLHRHVTRFNRDLNTMTQAITAFLEAKKNEQDPFETVFAVVSEEKLTETVASAILYTRPPDMDFRDLVENTFIRRRKAMLGMMRTLTFTPVQENNASLEALQHVLLLLDDHDTRVRVKELVIDGEVVVAPMAHLKRLRWKRHAVIPEGINPNYYELAAFDRLRSGLKAGDIAVVGSHRYQAFADYLFPIPEWKQLKQEKQTRLALADDPKTYLDDCQKEIVSLFEQLGKVVAETDSHLSFDKEGILHVTRLTKATPSEAEVLRRHLYSHVPLVEFAQLIADVDEWTDIFSEFPHLLTGEIPIGEQQAKLIATLMAVGMNIGLSKMAQASNFTEDELRYFAEWHIRDETIRAALVKLDNFVLHHPFSRHWGDGTTSSSDGMRVPVTVNSPNAVHNARYFWYRRGVTIVAHAADIWMPFYPQVMQDTSEALYVIDALCHHETDFDIQEHYTDTGGATYHVFALCRMLGFRFMPRIRGITKQYLYSVSPVTDLDEALENLIKGQVDEELVIENWDAMRRMSASIRHGWVTASLMMRKLSAYPKQNQLAQALKEVGKLERTIFSLKYLLDQTAQRRTLRGLNKGEAIWSAAQALDIMQGGELTDRAFSDQMNRASSRMLLVSMLSAWNTVYLDSVVKELRAKGEKVPNEYLTHVSPLGWQHVNLLGRYEFDFKQTYPLHALRPLRKSI